MLKHDVDYSNRKTWSYKFRKKRMDLFFNFIDQNFKGKKIRILDVGGSKKYWETFLTPNRQKDMEITVINIELPSESRESYVNRPGGGKAESIFCTYGDATNMKEYEDKSFDVVFSNSVIEHVGSFRNQLKMANEMRRIGEWVFCQTPNRYFPIEPHSRSYIPWWELMPLFAKVWLQKRTWNCTELEARFKVDGIHLLRKRDLVLLFPGMIIKKEKILFLTKSYITFGK